MPLFNQPRFRADAWGTLSGSSSETTIREITRPGKVSGYIDFTNMTTADVTVVRTYVKIKSGGSYLLQGQRVLSGVQTTAKLMHIFEFPTHTYGFKITLQQTDGVEKNYDYMMFFEG